MNKQDLPAAIDEEEMIKLLYKNRIGCKENSSTDNINMETENPVESSVCSSSGKEDINDAAENVAGSGVYSSSGEEYKNEMVENDLRSSVYSSFGEENINEIANNIVVSSRHTSPNAEKIINKPSESNDVSIGIPILNISALTHDGLDEFIKAVKEMFYKQEINFNDQVYITNLRQKEALASALESLNKAVYSIQDGMPEDFYTIDIMDAYTSLGSVIGEAIEDDLADEIFSKFCMGK